MHLGHQLGQLHGPSNRVDVLQIAVSGSALEQANDQGSGYWFPEPSILTVVRPVLQLFPATQLRIIWSQGETDMLSGIAEDQYVGTVQQVFDTLRLMFPGVPMEVYLVVPGALDPACSGAQVQDFAADSVRDAYNALHDQTAPPFPMRIGAHHYDLKHELIPCAGTVITDVHLSFSSYEELGQRIGDGIANPNTYFDVTGSTVVSANVIDLQLSNTATTPPAAATNLFRTTIRTGPTSATALPTSVALQGANALRLTYTGVNFTIATGIDVRYVAGAGISTKWVAQAVHSVQGLPLASRLVRVR
jgi:hypothetical protein